MGQQSCGSRSIKRHSALSPQSIGNRQGKFACRWVPACEGLTLPGITVQGRQQRSPYSYCVLLLGVRRESAKLCALSSASLQQPLGFTPAVLFRDTVIVWLMLFARAEALSFSLSDAAILRNFDVYWPVSSPTLIRSMAYSNPNRPCCHFMPSAANRGLLKGCFDRIIHKKERPSYEPRTHIKSQQ